MSDETSKNPGHDNQRWAIAAPRLATLQADFMQALLHGDPGILAGIPANSRTSNEVLLAVYQNAYAGRLEGVLASDYPHIKSYLGDEAFRDMAFAYIRANPSRTPNARWVGQALPEFLAAHEPYRSRPELRDLAAIIRALNDAFDARDDGVIATADLAVVAPLEWEALTFHAHPSTRRIDLSSNAFAIWQSLKSEVPPPDAGALGEPQALIAWRTDDGPKIRPMAAEEAMMWDEAAKGVAFGGLCELAAVFGDPEEAALRAAQHLQGWLAAGFLTSFALGGLVDAPAGS